MKELLQQDPQAQFRFWGGDLMQAVGGELVHHYQDLAIMGFIEALQHLPKISAYLKEARQDILNYKPDAVVLIDYGGFNLRIAKFAKEQGIKVFFYISPKVWAWNESRVNRIKQYVDHMFVILPFEEAFYKKHDYKVDYVGNPIADTVAEHVPNPNFLKEHNLEGKRIIAILPGSRKQEVQEMLHLMVSVVPSFQDFQLVIAGVTNLERSYYEIFSRYSNVQVVYDETYDLLSHAEAALVTSGTATLETALFNVPQVVCYKGSALSYLIARMVIKVKYISLVNLIAEREVVRELIQEDFRPRNIVQELKKVIHNAEAREQIMKGYTEVREKLGQNQAPGKTAQLMMGYMKGSSRSKV